jgi:ABC-2 type transport system ATP-binding protein
MGSNGAGKTTFINYLISFYTSKDQHPFLDNFQDIEPLERGEFGFSPEVSLLDYNLSARDYISMMGYIRDVKVDVEELLKSVHLDVNPDHRVGSYSKGMRQRLSLLLALIGEPEHIVLDEPTSGLDIEGEKVITEILKESRDKFKYIISTHSPRLAVELEDEVWLFKKGKIVKKFFPKNENEIWEAL